MDVVPPGHNFGLEVRRAIYLANKKKLVILAQALSLSLLAMLFVWLEEFLVVWITDALRNVHPVAVDLAWSTGPNWALCMALESTAPTPDGPVDWETKAKRFKLQTLNALFNAAGAAGMLKACAGSGLTAREATMSPAKLFAITGLLAANSFLSTTMALGIVKTRKNGWVAHASACAAGASLQLVCYLWFLYIIATVVVSGIDMSDAVRVLLFGFVAPIIRLGVVKLGERAGLHHVNELDLEGDAKNAILMLWTAGAEIVCTSQARTLFSRSTQHSAQHILTSPSSSSLLPLLFPSVRVPCSYILCASGAPPSEL